MTLEEALKRVREIELEYIEMLKELLPYKPNPLSEDNKPGESVEDK